ncbi:MAG TPA: 30S ribosomal protein S1 [Alphaproteobacteria bacterium]|nr:30S ribosomal protein S1 [Rhodospirillaceae bacterium]HRJ11690.1 30S ribosomal protein S1 [Alphaproteobacteria bacterium]
MGKAAKLTNTRARYNPATADVEIFKPQGKDSFASLLDENFAGRQSFEGQVLKGMIVGLTDDVVIVDVGLKSEGRIPRKEFGFTEGGNELEIGGLVDVFIERIEGKEGEAQLSRERARREEVWVTLEESFVKQEKVEGIIFSRVKGGFNVDLGGAIAFLPGSQVDVRPMKDASPIMNQKETFLILKMDRARGNIVVSRRAVMEESRADQRAEIIQDLREGTVLKGAVKNLTDYGAFVDLGGVDGLLHVTDISWKRINRPDEVLRIGQEVEVVVIRFNKDNQRISLGMKQLEKDPWEGATADLAVDSIHTGKVTNITDYGAFVEIAEGIEGLVHVSEMTWSKKTVHPNKIVTPGQEVQVQVLELDSEKRRISLGMKQTIKNPWTDFAQTHEEGTDYTGEISNITEFGLFVRLPGGVDGMVHMSDLSWDQSGEEAIKAYKKGDSITTRVMEIDVEKERVSLSVKALTGDQNAGSSDTDSEAIAPGGLTKGKVVTCTITAIKEAGIEVAVGDATGFIKKMDLSRDRSEQRTDRFAVGEKVDARIITVEKGGKKLQLSIKAQEVAEERAAIAEFGTAESGASLGGILGAALKKAQEEKAASNG